MIMKKNVLSAIVILSLLFLLWGCGGTTSSSQSSEGTAPGDSSMSGQISKPVTEDPVPEGFVKPDIEVIEDTEFIYYYKQSDNRNLYKKEKATGNEVKLFTTSRGFIHHLVLFAGRLYFVTNSVKEVQDSWLMSIDKNGGEARKEINNVEDFLISKDTIYYTTFEDEKTGMFFTLYRYDRATGKSTQLPGGGVEGLNYMNGKLYYSQLTDASGVMVYDPLTEKTEQIIMPEPFFSLRYLYAEDDVLLFSAMVSQTEKNGIFRYDLKSKQLTQVLDRVSRAVEGEILQEYGAIYRSLDEFYTIETWFNDQGIGGSWVVQHKNGNETILARYNKTLDGCSYGMIEGYFYLYYDFRANGNSGEIKLEILPISN